MKKLIFYFFILLSYTINAQCVGRYDKPQRVIYFEGNSLMNHGATAILNGHYIPKHIYDSLVISKGALGMQSFAISGQNQTQINAAVSTRLTPFLKRGDCILLWEGTNDMYSNGLSAADAFANVVTYLNTVLPYGVTVVIGTVIARDYVSDAADLMTRISEYNTLVRNNAGTYGYTVCDLAADPLFDDRADASNTTYYNVDKIHLDTNGKNVILKMMYTSLMSVIQ